MMSSRVRLQEAFKLALSMALFYWLALTMDWDLPKYGGLAIILIALGTTGASLQKGVLRIVGTTAGLAVGMLAIALFAQDRWLMLAFLSCYLVLIAYRMQGSRYVYAWFVAGFLPPLVWATTYGDVDNTFHFASFRYLETTAGIVIYTLVSAILWPRGAGAALDRQGDDLWGGVRSLYGMFRRRLEGDAELSPEAAAEQTRLGGLLGQMRASLQAAYADTPSIGAQKPAWETLRLNVRAFADALVLWRETIEDCRQLDTERLLPGLASRLDAIDGRLARIADLWHARATDADVPDGRDADLLAPAALTPDRSAADALPHFDRAALLAFVRQLHVLDDASAALLRTMRVLAGVDRMRDLDAGSRPRDLAPPARWDADRMVTALCPALCFVLGFLFWIAADPPTGPSVPNMASTFGLMLFVLAPFSALRVLPVIFGVMTFAVAPIYFLVMPRLDTGAGLLALVFAYTFVAAVLFGKSPLVKTLTIALFVMMTGISNDQAYSFLALANGGMMFVLALAVIAVVQGLVGPVRPEQAMLRGLRRFFQGCARVADVDDRGVRRRWLESAVLPAPARLRAAAAKLDHELLHAGGPDEVSRLVGAAQTLALRFQALELARERVTRTAGAYAEPIGALGRALRERLRTQFESWSRFEAGDPLAERAALETLGRDFERELDDVAVRDADDRALADLYAMLGCARSVVHAAADVHGAASRIDWERWQEARF
jgi:uncharacterized membrane protein YccC